MPQTLDRRRFVTTGAAGLAAMAVSGSAAASPSPGPVPSYLTEYADLYRASPKQAAIQWFRDARFGLFMHYGIYSLRAHGEWVQLREKIPVAEYSKLKDRFTAAKFDAEAICDMAVAAGIKYVNITARHHDSFCLFRTGQTDYSSLYAPARRDLIAELAVACRKRGLGLFLYYSYAADWKHPYFYPREAGWDNARPDYPSPQPEYRWTGESDFVHYIDFVHAQLRELLTQYGPLAGIWLDPIMGYYARPDLFPIEETYALIRSLQPQVLISFKQGANGDEDFAAPERSGQGFGDRFDDPTLKAVATLAWDRNKSKHNEICDTFQPRVWGYDERDEGNHRTASEVITMLDDAAKQDCNLLLNTGPLPDGSIHAGDAATLREVGSHLHA